MKVSYGREGKGREVTRGMRLNYGKGSRGRNVNQGTVARETGKEGDAELYQGRAEERQVTKAMKLSDHETAGDNGASYTYYIEDKEKLEASNTR